MSYDARDLNRDGKVSLVEKVKDKLHLGHKDKDTYTTTHHTTTAYAAPTSSIAGAKDLNHDGHISTSERLASSAMPLASGSRTGFTDSRDLNRDGHVSTSEKLASSNMSSGFADSRDLNRDGHVSTSEKLATAGSHRSGFTDSRDLNRDGHVSTAERLASGSQYSAGFDSRDLNRDGHVSTAEKLKTGSHMMAAGTHMTEEARLRLHEEQLAISKREVGAGEVDIHKRVQQEVVQQTIPVRREEVTVERHALHGVAEPGARIAAQDEVVRVPLFREEVITEKRVVPTEEVIVRKQEIMDQQTVGATLRSEFVETTQVGIAGAAFDRPRNRAAAEASPSARPNMAFAASTACCKPSALLAPRASSSSPLRAQALLCSPSTSAKFHGLRAPASAFAVAPVPRRRAASTGIVCGKVSKGSVPPNFTLKDQDGKTVSLSKFKGKPVVLYFYPADETPGCTKQACAFRDSYEKYKKAGAEVIGISGDDAASHKAFAKKYRLPFTLLSDEGNKVRKEWGVPSDLFGTLPGRQTYVLDKKGVVQYIYNNQFQPEKHIGETLKIIENL